MLTDYWLVPAEPLAEHALSVWLHIVDSGVLEAEVRLEFLDTNGGLLDVRGQLASATAGWQLVEVGPVAAPAGTAYARIRVSAEAAGAGATFYVDSAVLTAGEAPPLPVETPTVTPQPPAEEERSLFASLTNGDFELPGDTPYGWRAHAGDVRVASEGNSRTASLTSQGAATAWLHQSFAVEGGRWYEASGEIRPVSNASLARIRVAWYASEDASGAQLSTTDSNELSGVSDSFASVTTGAIRAPGDARSAQLRIMLRPVGESPAVLHADDLSFARTAPPAPASSSSPAGASPPTTEAMPSLFVALTNGDFELPGDTPYGWRAHAGAVFVSADGDSRTITLTSRGRSTAWLHQSFAVEAARWYEASGRLRTVSNASLARIRVAWYASGDASGAQLATTDSDELLGVSDAFDSVSTGAIRAPEDAHSAQLRIMLRPAGPAAATLQADDVSFARIAPPAPAPAATAPETSSATPEAAPAFFAALTNGDFELPGETPYGWRTHAAAALVTTEGDGSRAAALVSRGDGTAWLHQSFAVEGGRWYEAGGRLQPISNVALARIRVAWYASDDASGAQLSTVDSEELEGIRDAFAAVTTGAIRAPVDARSAQLRVMLLPAGDVPAVLHADDVSFARTAPPPAPAVTPPAESSPTPEATPSFFASLTNGDFELPGETPYGWRTHAATALVTSEGGSRAVALTSKGGCDRLAAPVVRRRGRRVVRGRWAGVARRRRGPRPHSRRLVRLGGRERGAARHRRLRGTQWRQRHVRHRLQRRDPRARRGPQRAAADHAAPRRRGVRRPARRRRVLRLGRRTGAGADARAG